mmetsp:Transcript_107842/g.247148  ORF Transcript_107842/g.247148 Transcript_107842/m.247148 type:complete len:250 (+) Transcript_107842:510-1259(+)
MIGLSSPTCNNVFAKTAMSTSHTPLNHTQDPVQAAPSLAAQAATAAVTAAVAFRPAASARACGSLDGFGRHSGAHRPKDHMLHMPVQSSIHFPAHSCAVVTNTFATNVSLHVGNTASADTSQSHWCWHSPRSTSNRLSAVGKNLQKSKTPIQPEASRHRPSAPFSQRSEVQLESLRQDIISLRVQECSSSARDCKLLWHVASPPHPSYCARISATHGSSSNMGVTSSVGYTQSSHSVSTQGAGQSQEGP